MGQIRQASVLFVKKQWGVDGRKHEKLGADGDEENGCREGCAPPPKIFDFVISK